MYYLSLGDLKALLSTCAKLSPPGSRMLMTMVCRSCLKVKRLVMVSSPATFTRVRRLSQVNNDVVKDLPQLSWFKFGNCFEDLLEPGLMEAIGWGDTDVSKDLADEAR